MIKSLLPKGVRRKKNPDQLRGHLDYFDQGVVGGWAGKPSRTTSTTLEVRVNGEAVTSLETRGSRRDLAALGFSHRNDCGFVERVDVHPYLHADSRKSNHLSVHFAETGAELSDSPVELPEPHIRSHIDRIDSNGIHGWLYDANYVELDIALDMYVDGRKVSTIKADHERQDLLAAGHPKSRCGFHFDHTEFLQPTEFGFVSATIVGTDIPAFRQPLIIEPLGAKVSALSDLAKAIRKLSAESNDRRHQWLLLDLLPRIIEDARKSRGASLPAAFSGSALHSGKVSPGKVDVVIPVYEGFEETLGCIDSALAARNKVDHRLIVINDKSPNTKLSKELRRHSERHGYILLENEQNLGFVGTVNRGMRLHDDADVVLLNSDTVVPDGWLDQIADAAYTDPVIGTVTPFSNNATICSYPDFCQDNALPEGASVNEMNRLFRRINRGEVIDLPTAHGFCMFIKRATLNEVGVFDDEKWGKGYGEENDFSLRAEQRGWRNVLALDTFVQHLGSVSFAENADQFISQNLEVLNGLYPDYAANVAAFVHKDPVRPYRNRVALEQLKQEVASAKVQPPAKGKTMLFVSLTFGGGTQVATDDLAHLLKEEGQCVLMLTSPKKGVWRLSSHVTNAHIEYAWPEEKGQVIKDLEALDVWHMHYHHTIEFPKEVWELPRALGVEYDVTIHDYFTICPRGNMVDETRRFCGEPPISACERCIKRNGPHEGARFGLEEFGDTVADWKGFHEGMLLKARKVFTPSQDTAERLSRHFHKLKPTVRPHPEDPVEVTTKPIKKGETVNVAFLGAIGYHKGYEYLVGCARYAQKFELPIHFHVIGYTVDDEALEEFDNVTVYGAYDRRELPDLIDKAGCQVAALLSVWPETFSYTLSESLRNGLSVVHFNMGAFEERLRGKPSLMMNYGEGFGDACRYFIEEMRPSTAKTLRFGKAYPSVMEDYYGSDKCQ
ncbi:MAG: glycosyltransferase [Pseudomonadota bacterium]